MICEGEIIMKMRRLDVIVSLFLIMILWCSCGKKTIDDYATNKGYENSDFDMPVKKDLQEKKIILRLG